MLRSLFVLAALLAFPAAASAQHGGKLPWIEDGARGMEEARKTGKNALLYFTADW